MIVKRKTKAGKVRYGVRVDRPGRKQEWIGTFATLGEARKAQARAQLRRPAGRQSVDRFVAHYLEGYAARVKDSSFDAAASALSKFATDWRGIPLGRISRIEAEKWAADNRWRVPAVIACMNAAIEAELIDHNPFRGLAIRGEGRRRNRPLSVAEVDAMMAAAGRESDEIRALVAFLAYTGVRVGEAFALEWTDIDFQAMRVRIERRVYRGSLDLPKSNKSRVISLTPPARDALLPIRGRDGLVFTGKQGRRLSQTSFAWYWKSIAAPVTRKVTPHELRHFAGHYLHVTLGLPDRVVAAQLGHDDGGKLVRELYGHGEVGALEAIDEAFDNVVPIEKRRAG